jgi:hypothetical protein
MHMCRVVESADASLATLLARDRTRADYAPGSTSGT